MGIRRSFKPTNSIVNGGVFNGTTGWDGVNIANETGRLAITAVTQYTGGAQPFTTIAGHVYYITGYVNGTTDNYMIISGIGGSKVSVTVPGGQRINGLFTATGATHTLVFADGKTSAWQKFWINSIMAIDLTAIFGAGAEPTAAWCAINIPFWFNGTLSGGRIGGLH